MLPLYIIVGFSFTLMRCTNWSLECSVFSISVTVIIIITVNSRYNELGYIEIPLIGRSQLNSPRLPNEFDYNKVRLYRNGYIEIPLISK